MISRQARVVLVAVIIASSAACSRTPPPASVVVPAPVPVVPAEPTAAAARRFPVPTRQDTVRYTVRSTTQLTRDSAGTPLEESLVASARVAFAMQRDVGSQPEPDSAAVLGGARARVVRPRSLSVSGRVDGFTITPTSRLAGATTSAMPGIMRVPPTPVAPLTVPFDAYFDGVSTRVVPRPLLANECDRQEMSAVALARELFVRLPRELVVGDRWSDSSRVFMCRGGVPITVVTQNTVTVREVMATPGGATLTAALERTMRTVVNGSLATGWRTITITGTGDGAQRLTVRSTDGAITSLDGESTVRLELSDSARPSSRIERVTQRVTVHAQLQP